MMHALLGDPFHLQRRKQLHRSRHFRPPNPQSYPHIEIWIMKDGNEHVKLGSIEILRYYSMLARGGRTSVNTKERVRTENRRKRVGVEPTKDRPAALPGFEVRTPHQGRFPSKL